MRRFALLSVFSLCAACGDDDAPDPATRDAMTATHCMSNADCDDGTYCNGSESCDPESSGADANGCVAGDYPCAGETCVEASAECLDCEDRDGDNHGAPECGGDDCDDDDPLRYPGNPEVCDAMNRDEDCDPRTFGVRDADGDGAPDALCCNEDNCGDDCDDSRAGVHPSAPETCDLVDNDCDSAVDEGVIMTFYEDADGDDFGSSEPDAITVEGCAAPPGFAPNRTDCDDTQGGVNPGAPETCDGLDNDCDGTVDEGVTVTCYADPDSDGYAAAGAVARQGCACMADETTREPVDAATTDCVENNASAHPGASELCDGIDTDCSEGGGPVLAEDRDGDGYTLMSYTGCSGGPFDRTDCYEAVGGSVVQGNQVNPGVTTYGTQGFCPNGGLLCSCGGYPRCVPSMFAFCPTCTSASGTPASFDYNCSGVNEPLPRYSGCSGSGCISACVGRAGPQANQSAANCGRSVPFSFCGGCPCATTAGSAILGCR